MTLESPSRLQRKVYGRSVAESFTVSSPQVIPRAAAADETTPFKPVLFARRGLDPHTRRNIILGSVLGSVGFFAFVLCVFLLWRYHRRRATSDENAMASSMVIQDPSQVYLESRQKPVLDVPPAPPPKPIYTPQRILNHPYASPYSRNAALPYTAPAQPSTVPRPPAFPSQPSTTPRSTEPRSTSNRSTAPRSTAPRSTAPRSTAPRSTAPNSTTRRTQQTPAPLTTPLHPYSNSSRRDDIPQPQPSAGLSDITYESFMSPLAPSILEAEHSPVASTAGGGFDSSTRNRITTFSNMTTDTNSSSAPLQSGNQPRPYQR